MKRTIMHIAAGCTVVVAAAMLPAIAAVGAEEQPQYNYSPRAEDFAKVFKSLESFSIPGWQITAGKVIDVDDSDKSSVEPEKLALLKEFHCNEYLSKIYTSAQDKITLELCRFNSPAGAYGAYTCFREGASTVVRRGDGSSEDDRSISFWQDNYLVLLRTTGEDSNECKDVMGKAADKIAENIAGHSYTPAVLSELPFMDRLSGSEHVFMGPLAARKFSPLHNTDDLILNHCLVAAAADYQITEPFLERLKIMLIDYGNPATAVAACRQFVNSVCPSCGLPQTDTPTIFKLSGRYAWCQVHGSKLGIISNGRRAVSVAMLGHQFNW